MTEVARKRWTAARKKDAVIRMMRGEPVDEVSRDLGVETYRLEKWKDQALASIEGSRTVKEILCMTSWIKRRNRLGS